MLSRFRQPAADFRVELSETTLQPGDELNVRVSLIPRDGFQVRRGSLEIVCTESFVEYVTTMRTGRYGSHYSTQRLKATRILSRYEKVFMDNSTMRRGLPYSVDVDWAVPPDAPPTASGVSIGSINVGSTWTVKTFLDVAGARDFHDSQEITVVSPPTPCDAPSPQLVTEAADDLCTLTLTIPTGIARSWDTLDGSLRAEILHDINVSEVRAELIRVEAFGHAGQDYSVDYVTLDTDLTLRRGEIREWHFQIGTGPVYAPSLRTDNSSVTWLVKCVLARRMRFDVQIEQEIRVDV